MHHIYKRKKIAEGQHSLGLYYFAISLFRICTNWLVGLSDKLKNIRFVHV